MITNTCRWLVAAIILGVVVASLTGTSVLSAATDQASDTFSIGFEYRPRIEYRDGYRQLPHDSLSPAYFASQRSRLSVTYSHPDVTLHTSVQDVRVWGEYGLLSANGTMGVYEAYADIRLSDELRLCMGRQSIEIDNGRLFSAANWSQHSRAHDGLRLLYHAEKISSQLIGCFNQHTEHIYETTFKPSAASTYKMLGVHTVSIENVGGLNLLFMNVADGYQSLFSSRVMYVRGTSGGRVEYKSKSLYATVSGYYQYGHLQNGQRLAAYYLQPEVAFTSNNMNMRMGLEYVSGDDALAPSTTSHSFVPLYGVTWKFMGNMDYFVSFPQDVRGGGLVNPYLSTTYTLSPKVSVRADCHAFFLQNTVLSPDVTPVQQYLGAELDLSCRYQFKTFIVLQGGISAMKASPTMALLRGGDAGHIPVWAYFMLTISPTVFEYTSAKTITN